MISTVRFLVMYQRLWLTYMQPILIIHAAFIFPFCHLSRTYNGFTLPTSCIFIFLILSLNSFDLLFYFFLIFNVPQDKDSELYFQTSNIH